MAVNASGDDRIGGGYGIEIVARGEFFLGPQRVVPAIDHDPFAGLVIFQTITDALLKFGERFRAFGVDFELSIGRTREVQMRVVESGHNELTVKIDDFRLRAGPFLNFCGDCALLGGRIADSSDEFSANRNARCPFVVTVVHGFDETVGQDQVGDAFGIRFAIQDDVNSGLSWFLFCMDADEDSDEDGDDGEQKTFQPNSPARGIVPFVQSVRAVGFATPAEGNRGDAERQRNIRVGGTVLETGAHAEKTVNATNGIEQRRIFGKLTGGADAERARSQLQRHAGVSRAGHFFFYAGLHRFAQRRFHFGYFGLVLRAELNLDDGARGDRIHGRAAFDDSKIVRAARIFRNAQGGKFDDAAGKRGDRIRRTEIRPTVTAGAGDRNFKTMRRDTLGGDVLGGGAIHRDDRAQARAVCFDQRANAAQIAFAFFAHVARENDGLIGAHTAFGKRSRDGDESCETRAVIGNARAGETIAIFFHAHVGISGKNSVEMRGEKNDAVGVGAGPLADYVSGLVGVNLQAKGFEKLLQELAALGFAKFRSGNFAERNLLVGHPFGVFVEPNESLRASG